MMNLSTLSTIPSGVFIAIGAIVASFITGLVSYTNIIISKETSISNFKKEWTDELRNEVSNFLAIINSLTNIVYKEQRAKPNAELSATDDLRILLEVKDLYKKMDALYRNILIRLTLDKHKELIKKINTLYELFHDGENRTPEKIYSISDEITELTRNIIEDEWHILQEGEKSFQDTKNFLKFGIILSFILAVVYIILI